MSEPEILWCCHVRGPDDVVATPDYLSALALADWLSAVDHVNSANEMSPLFSAVPAVWLWSPEAHKADLAKRATDQHDYPLNMNLPRGPIADMVPLARKHPLCRLKSPGAKDESAVTDALNKVEKIVSNKLYWSTSDCQHRGVMENDTGFVPCALERGGECVCAAMIEKEGEIKKEIAALRAAETKEPT